MQVECTIPEKLAFLFEPHRYKVAYGGRDGAKSTSVAKALLVQGMEKPLRIGCFREVQKSIKDSVHKLLSDQIAEMHLGNFYEVLQTEIRGKNGTEILFAGLSSQTRDNIKSFERLDRAWVEEAQSVSKRSWDILIPTIRAPGSEVIVTFNPDMSTDDTFKRFVLTQPPDCIVVKINYTDNPWRSKALDAEREKMRTESPEDYAHIYLGECRPAVEGAIYYNEVSKLQASGRLASVPYDPMLRVHVVADLGYNDFMSLILVQRLASEIRVIRYIEDRQRDIPSYSQELKALGYNWGKVWLPHDARAKTLAAVSNPLGATAQEQFEKLGWQTEIVENIDIEQGIRKVREVFPRVIIDKANASELVSRLGRYRRRVNSEGQASTPLHDDSSHGSDGFRYLALTADQMQNDAQTTIIKDFNSAFRRYG
jgi:phage terminase large subunit